MKQIKILLPVFVLLTYCDIASAQVIPEWTATYTSNNPVSIYENDMTTDKDGNVYITGHTIDSLYMNNIVTLKYNNSGQFQWARYIDSVSYFSRITVDDSGNTYVSGHSGNVLLTIKYSTQGVLQWVKSFLSTAHITWAFDIVADELGNVHVTGLSNGSRLTTIKYNTSGILQWAVLDSITNGFGNSYITLDDNKNVYITGRGDTVGCSIACKTIKYNSVGVKQWSRLFKSNFNPGLSYPMDIKYDPNGFVYLLANSSNNNNGEGDYVVVKYDTLGNQLWVFPYSFTSYYDISKSLAIDKVGNVYVTGNIYPTGGTYDSIATIKISKSGIFKWKKMYSLGYSNLDEASEITLDSLGYIYVTGKSSDSVNKENFVTIKYDSLGNQIWVGRYKNTLYSSDIANSISIDKIGNIYVSGTTSEKNSSGILTIKYSYAVGTQDLSNYSETNFTLYPNPASNSITVEWSKELQVQSLAVFDYLGREVLNKQLNNNTHSLQLDVSALPQGMYFLHLQSEKDLQTAKFIKQ